LGEATDHIKDKAVTLGLALWCNIVLVAAIVVILPWTVLTAEPFSPFVDWRVQRKRL